MNPSMEGFSEPLADHGAWEFDPVTGETLWSDALYRIHGVSPEEFVPSLEACTPLIHPDDMDVYAGIVRDAVAGRAPFACQHRIRRPDGGQRTLLVRGSVVAGAEGAPDRLIGTTQDVTGREGEEERLWHLANHDSLTGLFNRRRFMEELDREVAWSRRRGEAGAVLMLDLDHFKDINDSLGHMAGDALLARVAGRLRSRLRATDTLARLGGDEFAVVLPGCPPAEAERIGGELQAALALDDEVEISGSVQHVGASAGIAVFGPGHETDAEGLLIEADLAMYRAKSEGRGRVVAFDQEMRAELAARVGMEGELRLALERQELRVNYQPIVALKDGVTVGCEALVRWEHPIRGMVAPLDFIPLAEETGLIADIGRYVLDRACHQAADWRRAGHHVYVSVNVSPLQITREDIVAEVSQALLVSGLPAPLLCVEVTETSLLEDARPLVDSLRALKQLGVRIAIDDFGGGSSSLSLLRLLPIDQIKIDRMFVEGIAEHANDRAIVAAVLSLAEELGLTVVAEGVESTRQQGELRELGADFAQGFLYSRARFAEDLTLDGYSNTVRPGVGDPSSIREFMRQVGIPARIGPLE